MCSRWSNNCSNSSTTKHIHTHKHQRYHGAISTSAWNSTYSQFKCQMQRFLSLCKCPHIWQILLPVCTIWCVCVCVCHTIAITIALWNVRQHTFEEQNLHERKFYSQNDTTLRHWFRRGGSNLILYDYFIQEEKIHLSSHGSQRWKYGFSLRIKNKKDRPILTFCRGPLFAHFFTPLFCSGFVQFFFLGSILHINCLQFVCIFNCFWSMNTSHVWNGMLDSSKTGM